MELDVGSRKVLIRNKLEAVTNNPTNSSFRIYYGKQKSFIYIEITYVFDLYISVQYLVQVSKKIIKNNGVITISHDFVSVEYNMAYRVNSKHAF